jgi:hypothetical protein
MSEGGDYSPGAWSGHDFRDARQHYDRTAGRSYEQAQATGKSQRDLCPATISTQSSFPLVIVCDQTGSMNDWPGTIFSKLPYLDHELRTEYGADDAEISFSAVGDAANREDYPLQARPFSKGTGMKERLAELVHEGKGGGSTQETYELAALYYARNCAMPKAIRKPIIIFIGDESCYAVVPPDLAKTHAHVALEERMLTSDVFKELKRKFAVYFVQKPYGNETSDDAPTTRRVRADWAALIGEDHIAPLPEAGRVVDAIFGILAQEAGRVDYFYEELAGRQTPAQVATVAKALSTIHHPPDAGGKKGGGKSVIRLKR